jgi:hypothetical protein
MSRFSTLLLITLATISLSSCALRSMQLVANNHLQRLSFTTLANTNQGTATAIDVVLINDTKVIGEMPKSSAAWFSQKDALLRQYSFGMVSIEMAPLTTLKAVKLPQDSTDAIAIVVYVNMLTDQPIIRIPASEECVNIRLTEHRIQYETC